MLTSATFRSSIAALLIAVFVLKATASEHRIADFRLPDSVGKEHSLGDLVDRELVVVAFLGTECPLAKLYAARLQTIANDYAKRGVAVVAHGSSTPEGIANAVRLAKGIPTAVSFARTRYHALHAFRFVNAADEPCYARYHWEPLAGVALRA